MKKDTRLNVNEKVKSDIRYFLEKVKDENIDLKALGIKGMDKALILDMLKNCYEIDGY